jgi:hypothetical protein
LIFKDFPVLELFFQFKDFPGFSRPVDTLITYEKRENLYGENFNGGKAL